MSYQTGRFVWFELMTPDVAKSKAFWTEVIGWRSIEQEMGALGTYTMLCQGQQGVAGIVSNQGTGMVIPPHWLAYVSVVDVDQSARRVASRGGQVYVHPFDVPNVGRSAVVADDQGAGLALFRSLKGDPEPGAGQGAFHWVELLTRNIDKAVAFYKEAVGYTAAEPMPMGKETYYLFKRGGEHALAGLMRSPAPEIPPCWLPYVEVERVDATFQRALKMGGKISMPAMDVPEVGRFGVLTDNVGAALGVVTPARPR